MEKNFLNTISAKFMENRPTIFAVGSSIISVGTAIYAVWAGVKLKEDLETIDETYTTWDKVKIYGKRLGPVALGAAAGAGCALYSNYDNGQRISALTATVAGLAATQVDTKKIQAKAEEIMGADKTEKIKKKLKEDPDVSGTYAKMLADSDKEYVFRDKVTGYIFKTTLRDYMNAVKEYNNCIQYSSDNDNTDIGEFYSLLLGNKYMEAKTHNDVIFGKRLENPYLVPDYDIECGPDMQPVYVIDYDANTNDPTSWSNYD